MIMGPWVGWMLAAFFVMTGLLIGFTARGLVRRLSGRFESLSRNRGWLMLPVCALYFVWLPMTYNLPMSYVPFGFLAAVIVGIIILY